MTDQLEDLFADLRSDSMTRVRPPGSVAARRTLRRRRTHRTVGAAAFLAVAGAGGVAVSFPVPHSALTEAAEQVKQAVAVAGVDLDAPHSLSGVAASGVVATGLMVVGHYTLTLACVGRGRLTVTLRSGSSPVGSVEAECGDSGRVQTVGVDLAANLPVTTELRADEEATGEAGYAYQAVLAQESKDALLDTAFERLSNDGKRAQLGSFLAETFRQSAPQPKAGKYQVVYTCAGVGQVTVHIRLREADGTLNSEFNDSIPCGPPPRTGNMPFPLPAGGWVDTTVEPDADALGQSAAAVRLEAAA